MSFHTFAAVISAAGPHNGALTWWLASACMLAFLVSTTTAALVAAHQRKQRLPQAPHYRRHSPTNGPNSPD